MNKTQKTDLAVERLLKLIYPEGSELAKVSFNEEHVLNTTCDLIQDLTAKLTASEKKLKDATFDNVDRQVQVGDLLKDKERLQERVEELESSSLKTDCDHPWVIHKDGRDYCSECGEIK